MDEALARERLEALHVVDLRATRGRARRQYFCQLCLRDADASEPSFVVDCEGEGWRGRRCNGGHWCCGTCAAHFGEQRSGWAWDAGGGGCPACTLDDTDAGLTRLFHARANANEKDPSSRMQGAGGSADACPFLVRETFAGADAAAVAGVLAAERRAVALTAQTGTETCGTADHTWFPGGIPWWDCGAQLAAVRDALPPLAAIAETPEHGTAKDIALVSNGSALLGSGLGGAIDGHAVVVRFNEFECGGEYGADVGARVDIHATGWMMAAGWGPTDRLAQEEEEEEEEEEEVLAPAAKAEEVEAAAAAEEAEEDDTEDEEMQKDEEAVAAEQEEAAVVAAAAAAQSAAAAAVEVRLMPNTVGNGRAYFGSYLRAIVHHHHHHGRHPQWWSCRRALVPTGGDAAVIESLPIIRRCDFCGTAPARQLCDRCLKVRYCNATYQAGHWNHATDPHKGRCRRAAQASEDGTAPPGGDLPVCHGQTVSGRRTAVGPVRGGVSLPVRYGKTGSTRGRAVGPVCVVLRPSVYGRHWRHVIATEHQRVTPRVTSGRVWQTLLATSSNG